MVSRPSSFIQISQISPDWQDPKDKKASKTWNKEGEKEQGEGRVCRWVLKEIEEDSASDWVLLADSNGCDIDKDRNSIACFLVLTAALPSSHQSLSHSDWVPQLAKYLISFKKENRHNKRERRRLASIWSTVSLAFVQIFRFYFYRNTFGFSQLGIFYFQKPRV